MSDMGIKVSLPGYDVKTATPEQCAIHSKYPNPLIAMNQEPTHFGLVRVLLSSVVPAGVTRQVYKITHNLGYVPVVWCLYNDPGILSGGYQSYGIMPYSTGGGLPLFRAWSDNRDFVIDMVTTGFDSSSLVGRTLYFRYYLFADDALGTFTA